MAVGLTGLAPCLPVAGVRTGVACAGIYATQRDDLAVLEAAPGSHCAAVFTRNAFCAAPVSVARSHLGVTPPMYLLVNAGNANAGTGARGLRDAIDCCEALAHLAKVRPEQVLPYSTGVIGEALPVERIRAAIPRALSNLGEDNWLAVARAIMTTDTVPKATTEEARILDVPFTITGVCKGAGMICPDMATMLAFVATDASVNPSALQHSLASAVGRSFNRITVDGDTSTNDACTLIATGKSQASVEVVDSEAYRVFTAALTRVCTTLAQAIIRDAEGATKFITIEVGGGRDEAQCLRVAYAIAHSPLVKTAFFASDPNWGRILAAIGRAGGADLSIEEVQIFLDEVCIVREGERDPSYSEEAGQRVMARDEITVSVRLGRGERSARIWTSDLSPEYVRINADYRS